MQLPYPQGSVRIDYPEPGAADPAAPKGRQDPSPMFFLVGSTRSLSRCRRCVSETLSLFRYLACLEICSRALLLAIIGGARSRKPGRNSPSKHFPGVHFLLDCATSFLPCWGRRTHKRPSYPSIEGVLMARRAALSKMSAPRQYTTGGLVFISMDSKQLAYGGLSQRRNKGSQDRCDQETT